MTWLTDLENVAETTEQDVAAWVVKIKTGLTVIETDIQDALQWIVGEIPAVVTDLTTATAIVEGLGVANLPGVSEAVAAANVAVAGLNAFEASSTAGASAAAAVTAGYQALKATQAANATAIAAAVAAPAKPAAAS